MIENIKSLWKQIEYKTGFIEIVAKDLGKSPNTIHNHWFARFWQIPIKYQPRVIELMQNQILTQNAKNIEVKYKTVKPK